MQRSWLLTFILLYLSIVSIMAQSGPPLPTVTLVEATPLRFGDIAILPGSSGGTVIVGIDGSRSSTGEVKLLGSERSAATFRVKICPGRMVTVIFQPTTELKGNGGSMTLHLGPTSIGGSGSSFISNKGCNEVHEINVGGTLDVGNIGSNPAGLYIGTFSLTFVQQ